MLIKSPERVRLTGGRACLREPEHSYRSICSYRKLPLPACPGTACRGIGTIYSRLYPSDFEKNTTLTLQFGLRCSFVFWTT